MGLFDSVSAAFSNFAKKAPKFTVTETAQYQNYTHTVDSLEYLDQYEGYTYKASKFNAENVAATNIRLMKKRGGKAKEIESDKVLDDVKAFNPYMTLYEARLLTRLHLSLAGAAYWLITTEAGHYEFYHLDPTRMYVNTNKFGLPDHYVFRDVTGQENRIEINQLLVFKEMNPKNWLLGYSPLQASRYIHNSLEFAYKFNMNTFGNSGRPEGFLMIENLSESSQKDLEKKLRQKYAGVANARKIGVVGQMMEWLPITSSQKELDYIKSIEQMRADICTLHGIPLDLLGMGDTTFANAREAQRTYQQYTLRPMLELEKAVLNEQLLPKITGGIATNVYFEFDNPVEADMESVAKYSTLLYEKGVITQNEARELADFEEIDGGNDLFALPTNPEKQAAEQQAALQAQAANQNPKKDSTAKAIKSLSKKLDSIPLLHETKEAKRDTMKAMFLEKNLESERLFEKVTDKYFSGQLDRVLASQKAVTINHKFSVEDEIAIAVNLFKSTYESEADKYSNIANDLINSDQPITEEGRQQLKARIDMFATEINETTKKDLEKILSDAVIEDLSIADVKKQIMDLYDGYKDSRAEMIARTEINGIKNLVSRDNYVNNPIVVGLEWLSANDSVVRPAHREADGEVVPVDSAFSVGGEELKYPGDPAGSADNVINCRCTVLPVTSL
jgi:HK97 family phage portal protein